MLVQMSSSAPFALGLLWKGRGEMQPRVLLTRVLPEPALEVRSTLRLPYRGYCTVLAQGGFGKGLAMV